MSSYHALERLIAFVRRRSTSTVGRVLDVTPLRGESLERRQLLVSGGAIPAITGTVFVDSDGDNMPSSGEEVANATLQLFLDDGDGTYETNGDDVEVGNTLTDSTGAYCFDSLDPTAGYFVVQPAQNPGGTTLPEMVSGLVQPGMPNLVIDSFQTSQSAIAGPPPPSSNGSTAVFPDETEVIGAERDLFVELMSGVGEVKLRVNPFGLPVLQFDSDSGVNGRSFVTWDGADFNANEPPAMGLNGRDLTQGGVNAGIGMMLGVDSAGVGGDVTILLFQGDPSNVSEATEEIPVTDGTATGFLFIPFSSFVGPVSPTNVDAIQMIVGEGSSTDGQVDIIGALGPSVNNFDNPAGADLAVTKTNNANEVVPGETVTYLITVENLGPQDVVGATVSDVFPPELINVTYTSSVAGGASGNTAGSGNINDTVDMPAGSTITYTVTGTLSSAATGSLSNQVTVTPPSTPVDPDLTNNDDTDTDPITPRVDLAVTKSDGGVENISAGNDITYTIVATNLGPSDVNGATITDTFPSELTNVTFTSTTSGNVTGNTASGNTQINDVVDMSAGGSITYTVMATVDPNATGTFTNVVDITAPAGVDETDLSNNSASDSATITSDVDLAITKTDGITEVVPGTNLTYTIVATNNGPDDVVGASIQDTFPSELTNVTFTSSSTGGASGNTASGSGSLSDTVDLPVGSTITYIVDATVVASATGTLDNTATISPPTGVNDFDVTNNTATDSDVLRVEVDLAVTKDDGVSTTSPGATLVYSIEVRNNGPSDVSGARVVDTFPVDLTNVSYTSTVNGTGSGNTASGQGNIDDTVDLSAGGSISYTVTATVSSAAINDITNTVDVSAPPTATDTDPTNDSASDTDTLIRDVDLSITKDDGIVIVSAGQQTTYTIVVRNNGPADVVGAQVVDNFPAELTDVTFTSTASAGASGNTTSGLGNINDTVDLAAGSSITYLATGTVAQTGATEFSNTATVNAPSTVVETDLTDNSETDTDLIAMDVVLAMLSGFVYVDLDNDGVFDPDEDPIPGVEIILEQNGIELESGVTDNNGAYGFDGLDPGTYVVREIQPSNFIDGRDTAGSSLAIVSDNDEFTAVLDDGDNATDLNFGELPLPSKRRLFASSF